MNSMIKSSALVFKKLILLHAFLYVYLVHEIYFDFLKLNHITCIVSVSFLCIPKNNFICPGTKNETVWSKIFLNFKCTLYTYAFSVNFIYIP